MGNSNTKTSELRTSELKNLRESIVNSTKTLEKKSEDLEKNLGTIPPLIDQVQKLLDKQAEISVKCTGFPVLFSKGREECLQCKTEFNALLITTIGQVADRINLQEMECEMNTFKKKIDSIIIDK